MIEKGGKRKKKRRFFRSQKREPIPVWVCPSIVKKLRKRVLTEKAQKKRKKTKIGNWGGTILDRVKTAPSLATKQTNVIKKKKNKDRRKGDCTGLPGPPRYQNGENGQVSSKRNPGKKKKKGCQRKYRKEKKSWKKGLNWGSALVSGGVCLDGSYLAEKGNLMAFNPGQNKNRGGGIFVVERRVENFGRSGSCIKGGGAR